LQLDPEVRRCLLSASAATLDRLLQPIRKEAKPKKRRRRKPKKLSNIVCIRTFSDWDNPPPGYLEIDFVDHNGGSSAGRCIYSFGAVDICSAWVESVPLLAKSQELVVEALEVLSRQLPFPILGIDSDNDSTFINDTLFNYCEAHSIEFTRSRAYRKNDQAWIEQKNGAVIRRFAGYDRFAGIVAGQALAQLYQAVRLYVNYFQPSFKLREKEKNGSKVKRLYEKPMTPCQRLLNHPAVPADVKKKLELRSRSLDPVSLLHRIRDQQAALAALARRENNITGPGRENLEQFMKQLGKMWQHGEVRPTHQASAKQVHYWRTRKDPFESVWADVLLWLQEVPDATAKELFERLQKEHPGCFPDGQLRTLQRRVRAWRQVMARNLVFANSEAFLSSEIAPVGLDRMDILR
ncbi:MAG: ISNCY family transposase, partial [Methanosarcinaceae archaeon]|nr:ISNCY family transposase [Methanosarcinaceae archaeon]